MKVPQSWFKYRLPPSPSPTFHLFLIDLHQSSSDLNRLSLPGRPRSLPPSKWPSSPPLVASVWIVSFENDSRIDLHQQNQEGSKDFHRSRSGFQVDQVSEPLQPTPIHLIKAFKSFSTKGEVGRALKCQKRLSLLSSLFPLINAISELQRQEARARVIAYHTNPPPPPTHIHRRLHGRPPPFELKKEESHEGGTAGCRHCTTRYYYIELDILPGL